MAEIVTMPKLSDTMTEGVVAEWHKKVGDTVASGDVLAEIETDKATLEFESFSDGVLLYIGVEKGGSAPVDSVLAVLGEKGEDFQDLLKEAEANQGKEAEVPVKETKTEEKEPAPKAEPAKKEPVVQSQPQSQPSSNGDRVFASPLAKKLADDKGIDLGRVQGSGENGRVIKRDVESFNPALVGSGQARVSAATEESYHDENVSQMRKTIARRLAESKFSAPHFYLTLEIDMDAAIDARKKVNAVEGMRISFNDMVIKASAMALRKHPAINAAWLGDTIRYNDHVHVGVAVAVEDGLLVPVVRFADTKGMSQIGAEVKDYAQKAKDKKLQPQDWEGNTFTISNLGMYNIEEFTAIINPPDSCIMAIGGIKQVPVVKDGQVVPGNVMKVTLSCDHRVVDGVKGAEFLNTFKQYMENPVMMIV